MSNSTLQWTTAAPLWAEQTGNGSPTFSQPALLRFASDEFMDEFSALLASQPQRLDEYLARPETWRDPLPAPAPVSSLPAAVSAAIPAALRSQPALLSALNRRRELLNAQATAVAPTTPDPRSLKLFQPAHQRYYLVAANLVCRTVGLPDREVDFGAAERATFVVRRLLPKVTTTPAPRPTPANLSQFNEYALVLKDNQAAWQAATDPKALVSGEEQHALFPAVYSEPDGRRRRLFAGLVPVGRREAYLGAGGKLAGAQDTAAETDPRLDADLRRVFIEPWNQLIETTGRLVEKMNTDRDQSEDLGKTITDQLVVTQQTRWQIAETSWYLLLDFAAFLEANLKDVLEALKDPSKVNSLPTQAHKDLVSALNNTRLDQRTKDELALEYGTGKLATSLGDALVRIQAIQADLDDNLLPFDGDLSNASWPDFAFPLVDLPVEDDDLPTTSQRLTLTIAQPPGVLDTSDGLVEGYKILVDALRLKILAPLPSQASRRMPPLPLAAQAQVLPGDPGWFLIRCVFEQPNCTTLPRELVSEATQIFQMAGFFDPEAPARPIRIALPIDTTPAGLRKFDKNTAFMISDVLCGQIARAKGLGLGDLVRSVLPWPLHKDLDVPDQGACKDANDINIGMICSLSIPIITICALILLMIIVSLLDLIFRWIPYFILCFPLPKFNAKESS